MVFYTWYVKDGNFCRIRCQLSVKLRQCYNFEELHRKSHLLKGLPLQVCLITIGPLLPGGDGVFVTYRKERQDFSVCSVSRTLD